MAKVEVSDLSGTSLPTTPNPYDALLEACKHDPVCLSLPIPASLDTWTQFVMSSGIPAED